MHKILIDYIPIQTIFNYNNKMLNDNKWVIIFYDMKKT